MWSAFFIRVVIFVIICCFFFQSGVSDLPETNKPPDCDDCSIKAGDKTLINAVFLATGPGLTVPDPDEAQSWNFHSADEPAFGFTENTLSDIFDAGVVEFDSALLVNYGIPGIESPYCANYAMVCPGTYSYDQNGVRIESSGGGDERYRNYCCGDYPWTPVYKKSDENNGGNS